MVGSLPLFLQGTVIKGFGRGSKELGIPTANFNEEVVRSLPDELPNGVYFGWARVDSSSVYKMVASIGWNPFYKNVTRSIETHILHSFDRDFYDANMKVIVVGYLRPETDFSSKNDLISAIKHDISEAEKYLDDEKYTDFRSHSFLNESKNQNGVGDSNNETFIPLGLKPTHL